MSREIRIITNNFAYKAVILYLTYIFVKLVDWFYIWHYIFHIYRYKKLNSYICNKLLLKFSFSI